jgi:hypothetical protein
MNVDPIIAGALATAILTLQGWTLHKLVCLGEEVAAMKSRLDLLGQTVFARNQTKGNQ